MRTRSSRFFVILLHLLGVSNHHLPSWYYDLVTTTDSERTSFYSGIRGVHPHSIVLERLELQQVGGLDGVEWLDDGNSASSSQEDSQITEAQHTASPSQNREPFWLQDSRDGRCLGPSGGFSECGDATLWFILRRSTRRKSLRMGPFGVEETLGKPDPQEPYRYALQIVDNDYEDQQQHQLSIHGALPQHTKTQGLSSLLSYWRQQRRRRRQRDCLVASSSTAPQQHQMKPPSLELGSCINHKAAWSWRVNDKGVLYIPDEISKDNRRCLQRTKTSSAVLAACHIANSTSTTDRLVQFSLVRYHATTSSNLPPASQSPIRPASPIADHNNQQEYSSRRSAKIAENDGNNEGLPKTRDIAHSHANAKKIHSPLFEMNLATRPLLSSVTRKASTAPPFAALKDSNPILFLGSDHRNIRPKTQKNTLKPKKPSSPPTSPGKLRKIEKHPYIEASKNEIWVDPQTGLEYPTDLCKYLGHDRKEHGRHTLMGVGQFVKTMLKIKVYGIAFYVSKNDVLADQSFQEYADLSTEELRKRPDFYEKLRTQPRPSSDPAEGGFFDRTLFLKTNMQLSTETMRSSLNSDWKMLSDEAKALLIDSSLRPRPAEEQMLGEIKRDDNPSQCSCSQIAPEEYEADPSCCARGIELAFTWRKNGDLEVRLNGRLMDSFPRPDIAEGIFFEYLRQDDPFSVDFLDKVVDGFPFLLAPLAQVHGVTPSIIQQSKASTEENGNTVLRSLGRALSVMSSHATGIASALQQATSEAAEGAMHAVQSAGDTMHNFGEEMYHRRESLWKEMSSLHHQNPAHVFAELFAKLRGQKTDLVNDTESAAPIVNGKTHRPRGRIFRPTTSQWFGETLEAPDEIAPIIHPTMNKTILSLVHLYLLLLLVVSFPATNTSRARFVVRRSCKPVSLSSSEASLLKYSGDKALLQEPFDHKGNVASLFHQCTDKCSCSPKKQAPGKELSHEKSSSLLHYIDAPSSSKSSTSETSNDSCASEPLLCGVRKSKENDNGKTDDKMKKSLSYFL